VVITGVGRGLGRAHARDLARRGAAIVANDPGRDEAGVSWADHAVAEIEAAGGRAAASHDSVATPEGGRAMVELALERFGRIDVVIHNAGSFRLGNFEELTPEAIDDVLDVHLKGAFWVCRPAFEHMLERRYGRIVLTSSSAGLFGMGGLANYAAAKAGLLGLGKAIAIEGADFGIKANSVLPYGAAPWRGRAAHASRGAGVFDDHEILGPRLDPAGVSPLVSYLASRECAVSGEAFSALAGRYARVFVGLAEGWFAGDELAVTAEEIGERLDQIMDPAGSWIPPSLVAEQRAVARLIQRSGA
jgi:NAD(P)-dependent dehydrogenase (short-subunit alcohol dehydrogenase family)